MQGTTPRSIRRPYRRVPSPGTCSSENTDSPDSEWVRLERKMKQDRQFARETDIFIDNSMALSRSPDIIKDLKQSITEKEMEVQRKKELMKELKEKFIWDLAYAMKEKLRVENSTNYRNLMKLEKVSVEAICNDAEREDPPARHWGQWIESKFESVM